MDFILDIIAAYFFILVIIYFIPTILAINTKNAVGVFLLNLLLGWTVLGWLVSIIWAFISINNKSNDKRYKELIETLKNENNISTETKLPENKKKIFIILGIVLSIAFFYMLTREVEEQKPSIEEQKENINSNIPIDTVLSEKKWNNYINEFKIAFKNKDKQTIKNLTSKNLSVADGPDDIDFILDSIIFINQNIQRDLYLLKTNNTKIDNFYSEIDGLNRFGKTIKIKNLGELEFWFENEEWLFVRLFLE